MNRKTKRCITRGSFDCLTYKKHSICILCISTCILYAHWNRVTTLDGLRWGGQQCNTQAAVGWHWAQCSAAGKSDEGCDGNTFFFLLLLLLGSAFGYTGWKSYEFQGKCCAANAANREKERARERECALLAATVQQQRQWRWRRREHTLLFKRGSWKGQRAVCLHRQCEHTVSLLTVDEVWPWMKAATGGKIHTHK